MPDLPDKTEGNLPEVYRPPEAAFLDLPSGLGKIADAVGHLPDEIAETTAPEILKGAIELGRRFAADNGERINLAARIIHDPNFARKVLGLAKKD